MKGSKAVRTSAEEISLMAASTFDVLTSTMEDPDDSPELEKLSARPRLIDR